MNRQIAALIFGKLPATAAELANHDCPPADGVIGHSPSCPGAPKVRARQQNHSVCRVPAELAQVGLALLAAVPPLALGFALPVGLQNGVDVASVVQLPAIAPLRVRHCAAPLTNFLKRIENRFKTARVGLESGHLRGPAEC